MSERGRTALCAVGLFLGLAGLYLMTNAGRIDIIDGQYRYEVARNLLDVGKPILTDPRLVRGIYSVESRGAWYATYHVGASAAALPLMALSRVLPGHSSERDRFAFSMTGPLFGALGGAGLLIGFRMLGVGRGRAVLWAVVASLATLWWPGSVTVFDQNQHGVLILAATLLGWQSGRAGSLGLSALAGLVAGLLFAYQESYALLMPAIACTVFAAAREGRDATVVLRASVDRSGLVRYLVFGLCCGVGLALFLAYNYLRVESLMPPGRFDRDLLPPELNRGHPVAALLSLSVSPGKSVLLFSPLVVLSCLGMRGLFRRAPTLVAAIGLATLLQLAVLTQVPFFGGDWCWGPRYLLPLMPLWALALAHAAERLWRGIVVSLVALGLLVQGMGIAVDHHRFFLEHNLAPFFWADEWSYFKVSQFFYRPHEIQTIVRDGIPREAVMFAPTRGDEPTYTPGGPREARLGSMFARHFRVFHVPRPWPLWMPYVAPERRPVDPTWLLWLCMGLVLAGALASLAGLRRRTGADDTVADAPASATDGAA